MNVAINWLAIVIAALITVAISMVWYLPSMFGKDWAKITGKKPATLRGNKPVYIIVFVAALIQAYMLAHFIVFTSFFYPTYSNIVMGLLTGSWLWIGFVAIPLGIFTLFDETRKKLWAINAGYFLFVLLINSVLLAIWH